MTGAPGGPLWQRIFLVLCLLAWMGALQTETLAKRLWIDTDAACVPELATDVDDCWALTLLLSDPTIEIAGISSVFGNRDRAPTVEELTGFAEAISANAWAQTRLQIVKGADEAGSARGADTPAVDAIITELERQPMTILALGPLTNVAAALEQRPDLAHRIEAVIAVAGQRAGERFRPGESAIFHVHDMNFRKDVAAFETVLEHGPQLVLVPYAAGRQVVIGEAELSGLQFSDGAGAWLADISRGWLRFWQGAFRAEGFFPFDLVAAARFVLPGSLTCRETRARVIRRHGFFTVRDTLEVDGADGRIVSYCDEVSAGLLQELLARIEGSVEPQSY